MASFVAFEPDGQAAPSQSDVILVRDGFAWLAFFGSALWLACHRLWIETLVAAAVIAVMAALDSLRLPGGLVPLVSILLLLWLGFEANALRMAALRRQGYREAGVVEAANREDAEARYWAGEADDQASLAVSPEAGLSPSRASPGTPLAQSRRTGPALGLLDYPGGR